MITSEMVIEVVVCDPGCAEIIAAYATHRFAGLLPTDARREAGIGPGGGRGYERVLDALCRQFDLPPPRKAQTRFETGDMRAAGVSGGHQTNHVQRGRFDPDCPLCGAAETISGGQRVPSQTPPARARTPERARAAGSRDRHDP